MLQLNNSYLCADQKPNDVFIGETETSMGKIYMVMVPEQSKYTTSKRRDQVTMRKTSSEYVACEGWGISKIVMGVGAIGREREKRRES